jgi:hypothetical protein
MDIKTAAFYLLLLRIISSVALLWVISRQVRYLRQNNPPEEQRIRLALTSLTVILLGGNIIPIFVDVASLFDLVTRSATRINTIGVAYTFSNASFAAIAGLGWAFFYWLADREKVYLKKENRELHEEVDNLHHTADDIKEKQDIKDVAQGKKDVAQTKKDNDRERAEKNRKKA